jgi:hypothetical protein
MSTPAPSNQTPSAGRVCSSCRSALPRSAYSSTQWGNNAAKRKCTQCVQNQATEIPTAPAPTKPSAKSSSSVTVAPKKSSASDSGPSLKDLISDSDDPWLTPAFEGALTAAFSQLDQDKDGFLNEKELNLWCRSCNGRDFTSLEMQELKDNFFQSMEEETEAAADGKSKDQSAKGDKKDPTEIGLKLEGFLNFYFLQTSSEPRESIKDLDKLGLAWNKEKKIFYAKGAK